MSEAIHQAIQEQIEAHPVVLYMKGTRHFPQCGFSARVVGILDDLLDEYETVNVLADPAIRQGIKDFSSWPTIPQLYVKGEFVGGCDIVTELYASGELQQTLGVAPQEVATPTVTVSDTARAKLLEALEGEAGLGVRVEISPTFEHNLGLSQPGPGDLSVDAGGGLTLLFDRPSAKRAEGLSIDFKTDSTGAGFVIDNPSGPPKVRQIMPQEVKALIDAGETVHLFDVRTEHERSLSAIEGSILLNQAGHEALQKLPKDAKIVFFCHLGGRSHGAAEHFLRQGWTNVYNMVGGISAWAQQVDSSVPKY